MPQAVAGGKEHGVMPGAEALFVHLNAGVRLHDRRTQVALHLTQLQLSPKGAQGAFALQLHGIPHGNGIDMITHGMASSFVYLHPNTNRRLWQGVISAAWRA